MDLKEIIYSLNIEDIQIVANRELNRDLSKVEIELIKDNIAEYVNWYEAIANAINNRL